METHSVWTWIALAGAGLGIGLTSFSGLWWTVERTVQGRGKGGVIGLGFALRLGLVALAFWITARGDAARLIAIMAGFLIAQAAAFGYGYGALLKIRRGKIHR